MPLTRARTLATVTNVLSYVRAGTDQLENVLGQNANTLALLPLHLGLSQFTVLASATPKAKKNNH